MKKINFEKPYFKLESHEWYKGIQYAVMFNIPLAFRTGYVVIPFWNKHHFMKQRKLQPKLSVHGGITYFERKFGYTIVGFDCGHYNDGLDIETAEKYGKVFSEDDFRVKNRFLFNGEIRDYEFVKKECKNLIKQIKGE